MEIVKPNLFEIGPNLFRRSTIIQNQTDENQKHSSILNMSIESLTCDILVPVEKIILFHNNIFGIVLEDQKDSEVIMVSKTGDYLRAEYCSFLKFYSSSKELLMMRSKNNKRIKGFRYNLETGEVNDIIVIPEFDIYLVVNPEKEVTKVYRYHNNSEIYSFEYPAKISNGFDIYNYCVVIGNMERQVIINSKGEVFELDRAEVVKKVLGKLVLTNYRLYNIIDKYELLSKTDFLANKKYSLTVAFNDAKVTVFFDFKNHELVDMKWE